MAIICYGEQTEKNKIKIYDFLAICTYKKYIYKHIFINIILGWTV